MRRGSSVGLIMNSPAPPAEAPAAPPPAAQPQPAPEAPDPPEAPPAPALPIPPSPSDLQNVVGGLVGVAPPLVGDSPHSIVAIHLP
jgi:hypothetical protein